MSNHNVKLLIVLVGSFIFSRATLAREEKTKLERDLNFKAGQYEVTSKDEKNTFCLPGLMEISGRGENQVLYLGAHLLFGDINRGPVTDTSVDDCKIISTATSHHSVLHPPRVNVIADTVCSWGSYHDVTEIKFSPDSFEYTFERSSTDASKVPPFKANCTFKRVP